MIDPSPTTAYFREQVLRKRPYLRIEWCLEILTSQSTARFSQTDASEAGVMLTISLEKRSALLLLRTESLSTMRSRIAALPAEMRNDLLRRGA